jgi:HlyD family type I secretion membrane fusion protein
MSYQLPATTQEQPSALELLDPQEGLKRAFRMGLMVIGALVALLVALAALTGTRGAVIGSGEVTVESRVKKVAHPNGGVIAEVFVHEGQVVKQGDPLLRLDNTVSSASASAYGSTNEQLLASVARLTAERDDSPVIHFPPELTQNPTPAKLTAMAEAQRLFNLRRTARNNQLSQINERVRQTEQQISSLIAQKKASRQQIALIEPELEGLRSLRAQNLVTINRINQTERTAVDLQGSVASFEAQIAQSRAKIAEIRQSGFQLLQDARSQAGIELATAQAQLNDQKVRSVSATDQLNRSLLRAPYDGTVEKMTYSTIGGVVPPMETIMEIVPSHDDLTVEARVSPYDIDQLSVGQAASLRFSAFNNRTTPEINGKVRIISSERFTDDHTGAPYYKVKVEVSPAEMKRLGELKLVPGMPVEVFMQTGERSLLSYLMKPLRDQFSRAFREE